jgi:hypothetical protein
MATNLEIKRTYISPVAKGLSNQEIQQANNDKGGINGAIEKRVSSLRASSKEASSILTTLHGKLQNRTGFLKLMHTQHSSRTLAFETKSGFSAFFTKKERRSETEAALKGLFEFLDLKPEQLNHLNQALEQIGGNHLDVSKTAVIIKQAMDYERTNSANTLSNQQEKQPVAMVQGDPPKALEPNGECERRLGSELKAFRKISVGGIEIGGSARPLRGGLKNQATATDVLEDIQEAGFTHVLSLDQSKQYGHEELKAELSKHQKLTHLEPKELNIRDMFEAQNAANGENQDPYAGSVALSVGAFQKFKSLVEDVSQNGGKVLVHCGAGSGRTGTMLASLVLADLVKRNPSAGNRPLKKDSSVEIIDEGGTQSISTTTLVAEAIAIMRKADKAFAKNVETESVESEAEVRLLEDYQRALLENPAT